MKKSFDHGYVNINMSWSFFIIEMMSISRIVLMQVTNKLEDDIDFVNGGICALLFALFHLAQ